MVVALLSVALHIPEARSLKDKRMVLRSVKDRLKKFNVAAAEVEDQDRTDRAVIGIVAVGLIWANFAVLDEITRVEPVRYPDGSSLMRFLADPASDLRAAALLRSRLINNWLKLFCIRLKTIGKLDRLHFFESFSEVF